MDKEYTLRIDSFTPKTLPAARFAEYVTQLAKMFGENHGVHFKELTEGSAKLALFIDAPERQKVRQRVAGILDGSSPKETIVAHQNLNEMLAEDGAIAELVGDNGAVVLEFVGRNKPKPINYGPFQQEATVRGQLVRIGGQDATSHVILQDGSLTLSGISTSRSLATELGKYLYGPTISLSGRGKYFRLESGEWKMVSFTAVSFEILDDRPLSEIVTDLRAVQGSDWGNSEDPIRDLLNLRNEDGALH
jgi:hypothetical protein